MEALQTINANIEECLNLAVSTTSDESVSYPQQAMKDRITSILEAAKRLELWFVQETHQQKFSSSQTEVEKLRSEVEELRAAQKVKIETLQMVKEQVPHWTKQLETLQIQQLRALFELAPPVKNRAASHDQNRGLNTMNTDDMWWGPQATDESEDL